MNKDLRLRIYNKYDNQCAYCGRNIEYKDMQVDHLHPKARGHYYNSEMMKSRYGLRGDTVESFENLMPSCYSCNHYKRSHILEEFRTLVASLHKRISKLYITKVANDYGLITFKEFDGKFWFETYEKV